MKKQKEPRLCACGFPWEHSGKHAPKKIPAFLSDQSDDTKELIAKILGYQE